MTSYPPPVQQGYTGPGAPPPMPEGLQLSQHVGDLVYVKVRRYMPDYPFGFGVKDGIELDIEILVGRDAGERSDGVILSNIILVKQLRESLGQEMFARIAAQPGKNANPSIYLAPPWPGDEQYVNAYLARRGGAAQQQYAGQQYAGQQSAQPSAQQSYAQSVAPPVQQPYQPPVQQQPPAQYVPPNGQPVQMPPASPPPGFGQQPPQDPPF